MTEKKSTRMQISLRYQLTTRKDADLTGRPLWAISLTGDTTTTWEQMQKTIMGITRLRPQAGRRDDQSEKSEAQAQ